MVRHNFIGHPRRDIFPRMFMGFVGGILIGQLILLILYRCMPLPSTYGDLATMMGAQLFHSCFYGADLDYVYLEIR